MCTIMGSSWALSEPCSHVRYMHSMKLNLRCQIYIFHASTKHWSVITLDHLHCCEAWSWCGRGCCGSCCHAEELAFMLPDQDVLLQCKKIRGKGWRMWRPNPKFPAGFNTGLQTALDWVMIWIPVGSLINNCLGILFYATKILITWTLSEKPTHQSDCSSHTCQKRPFIERSPSESAQTTTEHPKVRMKPTLGPLLSPFQPLAGSGDFPDPISAYNSAFFLAMGLRAGLRHFYFWLIKNASERCSETWSYSSSPSTFPRWRDGVKRWLEK